MIRRPPRSTLFPSTTLSRSVDVEPPDARRALAAPDIRFARLLERERQRVRPRRHHAVRTDHVARDAEVIVDVVQLVVLRSEEHTSELQSQSNLVCRLLLEKK